VREEAFQCPKDPFLLLPTGFHSDTSLLKCGAASPYHNNDLMWDPKTSEHIPVKGYAVVRALFPTHVSSMVIRIQKSLHTM
jgi:hypothetical protein